MSKSNQNMQKIEWDHLFSIEVPEKWTVHEEEGLISVFNAENGVGVLQFSIIKRSLPEAPVVKEAIDISVSYALQRGWNDPRDILKIIQNENSFITEFSTLENCDGNIDFWRIWHFLGKQHMAFATYNCLESDKSKEAIFCDAITNSFEWKY